MFIKEENQKPLRQALDIAVGIDSTTADVVYPYIEANGQHYSETSAPYESSSHLSEAGARVALMDITGEGFVNDGTAIPAKHNDTLKYGWLTPFYADAEGNIRDEQGNLAVLTIGLDLPASGTPYVGEWSFNATDASAEQKNLCLEDGEEITISKWTPHKRVVIDRIVAGIAMQFSANELISVKLNLRAVETTIENPSLQASEIEIEAYSPLDVSEWASQLLEDTPIWYTAGYYEDMSPVRKFYQSDVLEYEDHVLTIHGQDATKYLDDPYKGAVIGAASGTSTNGGGVLQYCNKIDEMLTQAGITHEYIIGESEYPTGSGQLMANDPKRDIIAQAVNCINFSYTQVLSEKEYYARINYVDAGRPRLSINDAKTPYVICTDEVYRLKKTVESRVKSIEVNNWTLTQGTKSTIEEIEPNGTKFYEMSDPYWSLSTSAGTVSAIGLYKYKARGTSKMTISGIPLVLSDGDVEGVESPRTYSQAGRGIKVTLDDWNGIGWIAATPRLATIMLKALMARSRTVYEFEWRGDPWLQPRDWIVVNGIEMTIDTIDITHEGGGTTSTIVARGGFF